MDGLATDTPMIVSAYDWGALGHVVDVGGGDGSLLIALLNEYPALRGTVVDLPGPVEEARKKLDAAGLTDRANAVTSDFFAALPVGAEGYVLCSVLHRWGDEKARTLLHNCAMAAGEDGAVFVIEKIDGDRDVDALTELAERAGLAVAAVHTAGTIAIIEFAML